MNRRLPVLLALAALAVVALPGVAAEPAAPHQMFLVHVERPVPSMVAQYESTTKEFITLVHANHAKSPDFSFQALQADDLSYAYVTPLRNYAGIDGLEAGFDALAKATGERWADLLARNGAAIASFDDGVFIDVPDASYWPAGAATTPKNAGYYELDFYRVQPGKDEEAAKVAAEWRKLFASHDVPYGYTVFRLAFGTDAPLWVVSIPAKDPADLAMIQAASRQAIGADAFQSQMAKTLATCRGYEVKRYWARPDLSLAPPAMSH